ncbi:hypothetical protein DENSPDRAFT_880953 [Dentipellis sp. KUC8613]|nr:hypothetical protein DENSPDRAFT_880953 [Dentipellis sp. KUC8613]
MFIRSLLALALSAPALAAPWLTFSGCSVPSSVLQLPSNQTTLTAPSSAPNFVALGVGVQNYTCANTSTYSNTGAVAELFDISCLFKTPIFGSIQDIVFAAWSEFPDDIPITAIETGFRILGNPDVLGQHYFVKNPSGAAGNSPVFDFTSSGQFNGNKNAFILAAKSGDIPSPDSKSDVDWLSLNRVSGELADQVFRVETRGGQPPTSCTPGSSPDISVKYAAKYLFYGGSVKK